MIAQAQVVALGLLIMMAGSFLVLAPVMAQTQYFLTINDNSLGREPLGLSTWYDAGTVVSIPCAPFWDSLNGYNYVKSITVNGITTTINAAPGTTYNEQLTMNSNVTAYVTYDHCYYLAASASTGGSISVASGWSYAGAQLSVLASPSGGYGFSEFLLDSVSYSSNPITVTMNANHTLQAVFSPSSQQYYINVTAPANGTLSGASSGYYNFGTILTFTAAPNAGYTFGAISVDGTNHTGNPYQITVYAAHTVTAYFNAGTGYYLTVVTDGNEAVNQTSAWFANGSAVGILTTPILNYAFTNFTVDGALVLSNPTSVSMTANHTVYVYSYATGGSGTGGDGGIACPGGGTLLPNGTCSGLPISIATDNSTGSSPISGIINSYNSLPTTVKSATVVFTIAGLSFMLILLSVISARAIEKTTVKSKSHSSSKKKSKSRGGRRK